MIRKWINRMVKRYYTALANRYFERMTHQDTMHTFVIKDNIGGVGVLSFTNKENFKNLIDDMQKRYEQW